MSQSGQALGLRYRGRQGPGPHRQAGQDQALQPRRGSWTQGTQAFSRDFLDSFMINLSIVVRFV